jgi:hypothetical protein
MLWKIASSFSPRPIPSFLVYIPPLVDFLLSVGIEQIFQGGIAADGEHFLLGLLGIFYGYSSRNEATN